METKGLVVVPEMNKAIQLLNEFGHVLRSIPITEDKVL